MNEKTISSKALAEFLIGNCEKENVISSVFEFFNLDSIERSKINPSDLDNLIRNFLNDNGNNVELLTQIIEVIKVRRLSVVDKEYELLKIITAYINEHYTEDKSIEEIAEELHISYYYMCHIFKAKNGTSVNHYRTTKRLEKAMRSLICSDEKISDIAISCGFNSVSYFTKTFTKIVGVTPTVFRENSTKAYIHDFYGYNDILLAAKMPYMSFIDENVTEIKTDVDVNLVHKPDETFGFLHEAAIIEYHGVLYASWYNCPVFELKGFTPICEKRSYDGGKTWTDLKIICEDRSGKILYCPPVYGICGDRLYMFVNQMVAPDHIHSLDLYVLGENGEYELLWSRPIPFKLNTNVVALPDGKFILPGRMGELDGFPTTPAVLINDKGDMEGEWRLVKVRENGILADGESLEHPETTLIISGERLYMFNRNDQRRVPLLYFSDDFGESWSEGYSHDIPYVSSKIYTGALSDGRKYLIANMVNDNGYNRTRLEIYFTKVNSDKFSSKITLFNKKISCMEEATICHYPCAYESDGFLYVIASLGREKRGAVLFKIKL